MWPATSCTRPRAAPDGVPWPTCRPGRPASLCLGAHRASPVVKQRGFLRPRVLADSYGFGWLLVVLHQIPPVAVQIEEDGDCAVPLLARLYREAHATGLHG